MPYVRAAAVKLWAWHQAAQHRPPVTPDCPKCGKTAADFPTGVTGLRNHISRCTLQELALLDEAADAQRAAAVKVALDSLGLSVVQVSAKASNVCPHAAGFWLSRYIIHIPSVRVAAAKLWAWYQTAQLGLTPQELATATRLDEEADAQQAAAVRKTIHRLGLTVTQAATEACAAYRHANSWLRRDNTHKPSVRAAGAKLWTWHQTAQHKPTPEPLFDEDADAQRAAAVKATVDRLGLSNAQAATEAGNVCQSAAGCWLRRVDTHMPAVRAAAAKLWSWHQTAQHTPSATAHCPKCGKTAAGFPSGASGLRIHVGRCSGPGVQTGADEATDAQQATAVLGTIQTPGQNATENAANSASDALGLQCSRPNVQTPASPLVASALGEDTNMQTI